MDVNELVSAVIVTHNRARLCELAVQSALEQSYTPLEVIVVDDASEDDTPQRMRALANEHGFTYIRIEPEASKGGNHARNVGIEAAKGEWIAFLDDDDRWLPTKIEKQIARAHECPAAGVIGCRMTNVDAQGTVLSETTKLPQGDLSEYILSNFAYLTSTMMVRKDLLDSVGRFDEDLTHYQDYELQMRLYQACSVAAVDEPLVLYLKDANDKARLSNHLEKWEKAIVYLEDKHRDLVAAAPRKTQRMRRKLIAHGGALRSESVGDRASQRRYLFRVFLADPSAPALLRALLVRNSLH